MSRPSVFSVAVTILMAATSPGAENPRDRDGDGISDAHEQLLGTDSDFAQPLRDVLEDGLESDERRRQEQYDATKDVRTIGFCHVGGDRYLWRATLAAPPRLEDTVFHLYVDADADESTGRQGPEGVASTGTEYMLSVVGGQGRSSLYDSEGNRTTGPLVSFAVDGNALLVSADVDLGRGDRGARFALYVLCHTVTDSGHSPRMSDATGKRLIAGAPVSDRKKIMRPGDYKESFGVLATHGADRLRDVLREQDNIVIGHDELQMDGFVVDHFTTRRWPHVRREVTQAKVWAKPPSSGRYHVGFMMYDDSNDERVGIYIDGKLTGVAVANRDDNQTWLHWLEHPLDFSGGERVELRALGAGGKHGICNLVFLASPPEVQQAHQEVRHMASAVKFGQPGRVTLSWVTTWPCPTRFEYGADTSYGKTIDTGGNCLVHRVVLDDLDPNVEYHGRAVGTARDGSSFFGQDYVFQARPPTAPQTRSETASVPLTVRNPHSFPAESWPIASGIPFPQGELGSADHVRLMTDDGEVPSQVRLLARWPDGSVKWLLVNFQADVPAGDQREYRLQYGRQVERAPVSQAISVAQHPDGVAVDTGALRFRIDRHGNLADLVRGERKLLAGGATCHSLATDSQGRNYSTSESEAIVAIEEVGPLRAVVKVTSDLMDSSGEKLFRIEKRIEAHRGVALLRIRHTFIVDRAEKFTNIERLTYRVPLSASGWSWRAPTEKSQVVELNDNQPAVRQRLDDEFVVVTGDRETSSRDRIIGSIVAEGKDGCAVAVRDFWQNYPKAFSIAPEGLDVELCPDFDEGLYDLFSFEKKGHQLYYYLLNGHYRLKRGVAKTHEMFVCFEPPQSRAPLCALFQSPLLATASPQWYCGSNALYDVAPRNSERFQLYEQAIDKNLEAYAARRDHQHDFGALNFGDWYGERGTNWGNIEYDTQHAFFLEYIRSGNPAAFTLGEAAELHNRDVDTVHWSDDRQEIGAVYVHQMCHVGEYYDRPVPGFPGYPRGGYTVSHAWTEGHFDHYFLTGDRRSYETGQAVADFFIRKELGRPYDFSSCRTPGWHLIMLAATYAATNDPYYLNASRVIVERVLETQDKQSRPLPQYQAKGRKAYQQGGWSRMMVPGHCTCEPRHRGNAGFMIAVLLSGLKYYHDVTGDLQVKEAIIRGAQYLLDETYSDEVQGFRYTSCPNTGYRPGASPLMVEGVARAYLWTKDERFRRVLTEALPIAAGGSSYGKGFSMYYRMAPRVLADLDAAGIVIGEPPAR